jgi:hypothetical protein
LFYDYRHKKADSFSDACSSKVDVASLNSCKHSTAHRISWQARYKNSDCFEFCMGSAHVVAGKRVARTHELYCSLATTF